MEISINELEHYANILLDAVAFDDKFYNGIQVTTRVPITKIATAVSICLDVIDKAIEMEVQALIVHHGLFRKDDHHCLIDRNFEYVRLLMMHNIALLCYHLPLDAHNIIGNNWGAAKQLGLTKCQPFLEYNGKPIGVIGEANMTFDLLLQKAAKLYGKQPAIIRIHDMIHKVAIVSGAADRFVKDAALAGADCFITGRVDEPVWKDAHEYNISFLGFGHYATETIGPKLLAQKIEHELSIPATFISVDNPF